MHHALYNEFRLGFSVVPVSPLLIASGGNGVFVRSPHVADGAPTAYLPGSTIKGGLRRAAEQLFGTAGIACCSAAAPCSSREGVRSAPDGAAIYRALCPACRLFGSRALRSPLIVSDAYPLTALDELAIHELPGDESCEAVFNDSFDGDVTLHNFERWHIGLIGQICQHINAGRVTFGANGSTGMGHVLIAYTQATISYFGVMDDAARDPLAERLHGVGQFLGKANPYGFAYPDLSAVPDVPPNCEYTARFGLAEIALPDGDAVYALIANQGAAWEAYAVGQRAA